MVQLDSQFKDVRETSAAAGKALLLKAYIADGISDARAKSIKRQ